MWVGKDVVVKVELVGGYADIGGGGDVMGAERPAAGGDFAREAVGDCHGKAQGFFDYAGEVGEEEGVEVCCGAAIGDFLL